MSSRALIPTTDPEIPAAATDLIRQPKPTRQAVSAPALHTARMMLRNFAVSSNTIPSREPPVIPPTEYNLAVLIDVCTNVFRLEPLRPKAGVLAAKVFEGTATKEEVYQFLYDLNIVLNWMPSY